MATRNDNIDALLRLLAQGPLDGVTVARALGISQPTFSRLWAGVEDGIAIGAARARRYARKRRIPGVDTPIPVFIVSEQGQASQIGLLDPLQGGWMALTSPDNHDYRLFEGMPFFLSDVRPQGFLGRLEPMKNRDLGLPEDILLWSDDQVLTYLARRGEHAAGNIFIGNESYGRFLASVHDDAEILDAGARAQVYPLLAEDAMRGDLPGSSAGGEQPKFTHLIRHAGDMPRFEHVIVKFSPRTDSASGRRWADLLVCEHLAAKVLLENGIAAARSAILESDGRVFLEVVRFDRNSRAGRLPMLSFSGLDGELGMLDQNWTAIARELQRRNLLSPADRQTVEMLDLYGTLIGNTDKHHGNIAVSWAFDAPYRLLPAYDTLPMYYRPNAHGEIVHRTWNPSAINRLELRHLPACFHMAQSFWLQVCGDARISEDFKKVATQHLASLQPLNPQAPTSPRPAP
ncbi:MAG: HipA-like N-terminal protein [Herbaspirillum sp.]|jgi:hypothetical protein|nr:HipA-like N-terminal protein [Herbaspirillum sp.]